MKYQDWLEEVPVAIRQDALWRMELYRAALFIGDLAWYDSRKLIQDRTLTSLADQLYRAVGSISANISEGYSRSSGKDQARFYEYALGSAREARDWYYKSRHVLTEMVTNHRLEILASITRQLLSLIQKQRSPYLKEEQTPYETKILFNLLDEVPMAE